MSIEHQFDNVKTASKELNKLGFSLRGSFFHGEIYHVVPEEMPDGYPMMGNRRTPRFVAFVNYKGTLTFDKPFDENPILMRYYEMLMALVTNTTNQ